MKRILKVVALLLVTILLMEGGVALADYYADIVLQNTSATVYPMLACNVTVNNDYMASSGFFDNVDGLDTRLLLGTAEQKHMLADNRTMFALPVNAHSSQTLLFTTGSSNLTHFPVIPGYSGNVTVTDAANIELSDNFTVLVDGWIDTTVGSDKNIINKPSAFLLAVDNVTSETINARIGTTTTSGNITPYSSSSDGYIYALDANYATSNNAATGTANSTDSTLVIGQRYATYSSNQTAQDTYYILASGTATLAGERVDGFSGIITQVQLYLKKTGSPTGTAYLRIKQVSGDSLIGTLGTLDVSTLGAGYAWITFSASPVTVSSSTDIRIVLEYTGGTFPATTVDVGAKLANASAFGVLTYYDGSWNDDGTRDATFRVFYNTGYRIDRTFVYFDTSPIPDDALVSSAVLRLYGQSDQSTTDFDLTIQSGMPTYPTDPLAATDYNKTYYTATDGTLSTSGFTVAGYNSMNLTTSWVNRTGVTKLCLRSSRDISATTPTGIEYVVIYSSEEAGTSKDPQLIVYYEPVQVSATGVTSNEHLVIVSANTTHFWIAVDGSVEDIIALGGNSIPDNSDNWTMYQDNSLIYSDNLSLSVNGVVELWYRPTSIIEALSATTGNLTDLTNAYNHGVIHYGANPTGILLTMGGLIYTVGQPEGGITLETPGVVPDIEMPGTMYQDETAWTLTGDPIYTFVAAMSEISGLGGSQIPIVLMWFMIHLLVAIIVFVVTFKPMHNLLISGSLSIAVLGYGVARTQGLIPFWVVIVLIIALLGLIVMERKSSL